MVDMKATVAPGTLSTARFELAVQRIASLGGSTAGEGRSSPCHEPPPSVEVETVGTYDDPPLAGAVLMA